MTDEQTQSQVARFVVEPHPAEQRYVLVDLGADRNGPQVIGEESYVDFDAEDARVRVMFHTEVSKAYSGQGLAAVLVQSAVDHAISEDRVIAPVCPYVALWFKRHPEYSLHAVAVTPAHLRAVADSSRAH